MRWIFSILGGMLLISAFDKWFLVPNFTSVVASYRILLPPWDGALAFLLPIAEFCVGLGLLFLRQFWVFLGFFLLCLLYLLGVFHLWWMGYTVPCGCFSWLDGQVSLPVHFSFNLFILFLSLILLFYAKRKKLH